MSNEKTLNELMQAIYLHKNNANISTQNKGVDIATNAPIPLLAPAIDSIKSGGARIEFDNAKFAEDLSTSKGLAKFGGTNNKFSQARYIVSANDCVYVLYATASVSIADEMITYNIKTQQIVTNTLPQKIGGDAVMYLVDDNRICIRNTQRMYLYTINNGTMSAMPDLNTRVGSNLSGAQLGRYLFYCYSISNTVVVVRYDMQTGASTDLPAYATENLSYVEGKGLKDYVVFSGGFPNTNRIVRYTESGVRTQLMNLATAKYSVYMGGVENKLVVGPGATNSGYSASTELYNVGNNTKKTIANATELGSSTNGVDYRTTFFDDYIVFYIVGKLHFLNVNDDSRYTLNASNPRSTAITNHNGFVVFIHNAAFYTTSASLGTICFYGNVLKDGSMEKEITLPLPKGAKYDLGDGEKTTTKNEYVTLKLPVTGWIEYTEGVM